VREADLLTDAYGRVGQAAYVRGLARRAGVR
jgi:hypothetical protein